MKTVAKMYASSRSFSEFGVQGYNIPIINHPAVPLGQRGTTYKYREDVKKRPREYMFRVIEKSKQIPDPQKYSKIINWTQG